LVIVVVKYCKCMNVAEIFKSISMAANQPDFGSTTSLPISRESDDWGSIEAFLQVVYRTGSLAVRGIWQVVSPDISAKFERRSKGLTAITTTVLTAEDFQEGMTLSKICDSGLVNSDSGIRVRIGNIPLPSGFLDAGLDGTRKQGRGRRVFECLIAKTAIGKSFMMDDPDSSYSTIFETLPKEFDSVLIKPTDEEDRKQALTVSSGNPANVSKGFLPPHVFCQTYILRDGTQLLPMYVCRFEIDSDKDEPLALGLCQSCEEKPATIWCAADSAALCPECDEVNHSVNHLTQRHIRVPINERPRPAGPCSLRLDKSAELWNEAMGLAVCTETQKEHYSTTVFEDIKDAYKSSVRVARREDEDLEDLKKNLLSRIKAQDEAIESLERMFHDTEETCHRKIGDALKKALMLTERRTAALLKEEKEIKIKLDFANWAENLLEPFAHIVPPPEWLDMWLTHYRMTREYFLSKDPSDAERSALEFDEELKVRGQLFVKDFESDKVRLPVSSSS
jgi:hypothetical protein